jgi:hypothetical protein
LVTGHLGEVPMNHLLLNRLLRITLALGLIGLNTAAIAYFSTRGKSDKCGAGNTTQTQIAPISSIGYWEGNNYFCQADHNWMAIVYFRHKTWHPSTTGGAVFNDRESAMRYVERVLATNHEFLCPLAVPDWRAKDAR